jgi:hypothetical protein
LLPNTFSDSPTTLEEMKKEGAEDILVGIRDSLRRGGRRKGKRRRGRGREGGGRGAGKSKREF